MVCCRPEANAGLADGRPLLSSAGIGSRALAWEDPVMASDRDSARDVDAILSEAARPIEKTLFVMGAGFDPRCLAGIRRVLEVVGKPNLAAIEPEASRGSRGVIAKHRESHFAWLKTQFGDRLTPVDFPHVERDSSAGRLIAQMVTSPETLGEATTAVLDMSALPSSISFPCASALMQVCDDVAAPLRELVVVVTENPGIDHAIRKGSVGDASVLPGFGREVRVKTAARPVRVWAPVLGPGADAAMRRIAEKVDPQEVCPILPFPATDMRLADRLILEHRQLFLDERRIQPGNVIHAAEHNPFDLYRTLVAFEQDYRETLAPLGGARVHLSSHGSKLLSVGVLLAAYECGMPVYAVRTGRYTLAEENYQIESRQQDRLTCMWLKGRPYLSA